MKKYYFLLLLQFNLYNDIKAIHILPYEDSDSALQFVKNYLPEKPYILEAGAFIGRETILMKKYWPDSIIYAFEPVPELFNQLSNNTKHLNNVFRFQYALGNYTGEANFYISETINTNTPSASSSLLPPKDHLIYHPATIFPKTISVQVLTLDDWVKLYNITNIDFMWLDMQGFELPMLKKSVSCLTNVKVIYLELNFVQSYLNIDTYSKVKNWLEDQGFELIACDFDPTHALKESNIKLNETWYGNGIFINKKFY